MNKIEDLYYQLGSITSINRFTTKVAMELVDQIAALKAQRTKEKRNIKALRKGYQVDLWYVIQRHSDWFEFEHDEGRPDLKCKYKLSEIKQAIRNGDVE